MADVWTPPDTTVDRIRDGVIFRVFTGDGELVTESFVTSVDGIDDRATSDGLAALPYIRAGRPIWLATYDGDTGRLAASWLHTPEGR